MKTLFLSALVLVQALTAMAADSKPVETAFLDYWKAFSSEDFPKAAAAILPDDLAAAKSALLPVFLKAQSQTNKEIQQFVTLFFGKATGKARASLTPQEAFVGLNRIIKAGNPEVFQTLKQAALKVMRVTFSDEQTAVIRYQITIQGETALPDEDKLVKKDGQWWLRLKSDPQAMAQKFEAILSGAQ